MASTAATVPPSEITYPHIVKDPQVRWGKATIDGTRIAVLDIVSAHRGGLTPEQICTHFSSRPLTLGEVHAALAYAYDHAQEIEEYFEREKGARARVEALQAKILSRKAGR